MQYLTSFNVIANELVSFSTRLVFFGQLTIARKKKYAKSQLDWIGSKIRALSLHFKVSHVKIASMA